MHSNSIVLRHVPDVGAHCPQPPARTAANISFLLACSVCVVIFPLLASSDAFHLRRLWFLCTLKVCPSAADGPIPTLIIEVSPGLILSDSGSSLSSFP